MTVVIVVLYRHIIPPVSVLPFCVLQRRRFFPNSNLSGAIKEDHRDRHHVPLVLISLYELAIDPLN